MEYIKLIAVVVGATGFWRLLEIIIKFNSDKKLKTAETKSLNAQAESHMVGNWVMWSQTLEKRVKELEAVAEENKELKNQIESQQERICELESKVNKVEEENAQLRDQLKEFSKTHEHE